jgi:hypothetical protein
MLRRAEDDLCPLGWDARSRHTVYAAREEESSETICDPFISHSCSSKRSWFELHSSREAKFLYIRLKAVLLMDSHGLHIDSSIHLFL